MTDSREMQAFIRFPWTVYRGKQRFEHWVPPLLITEEMDLHAKRNPFFKHAQMRCFLCYRDGHLAGGITAILDLNDIRFQEKKDGFFSCFEAVDDEAVAEALFDVARAWNRELAMDRKIGPMHPSTNHVLGVPADSFERPPVVQMNYIPPYYPRLCRALYNSTWEKSWGVRHYRVYQSAL